MLQRQLDRGLTVLVAGEILWLSGACWEMLQTLPSPPAGIWRSMALEVIIWVKSPLHVEGMHP